MKHLYHGDHLNHLDHLNNPGHLTTLITPTNLTR